MKTLISMFLMVFSLSVCAQEGFLAIGSTSWFDKEMPDEESKIITLCKFSDKPWYTCADSGSIRGGSYDKLSYNANNKEYVALGHFDYVEALPKLACLSISGSKKAWVDCGPTSTSNVIPAYYYDMAHNEAGDLVVIGTLDYRNGSLVAACKAVNDQWKDCSPNSNNQIEYADYEYIGYGNGEWVVVGSTRNNTGSDQLAAACYNNLQRLWKNCSSTLDLVPRGISYDSTRNTWMATGFVWDKLDYTKTYFATACRTANGPWISCGDLKNVHSQNNLVFINSKGEALALTTELATNNDLREKARHFVSNGATWVEHSDGLKDANFDSSLYYQAAYGDNQWLSVGILFNFLDFDDPSKTRISCFSDGNAVWHDCLTLNPEEGYLRGVIFGELGELGSFAK